MGPFQAHERGSVDPEGHLHGWLVDIYGGQRLRLVGGCQSVADGDVLNTGDGHDLASRSFRHFQTLESPKNENLLDETLVVSLFKKSLAMTSNQTKNQQSLKKSQGQNLLQSALRTNLIDLTKPVYLRVEVVMRCV